MAEQDAYKKLPLETLLIKEKEAKRLRILFILMAVGTTGAVLYSVALKERTGFLQSVSILFSLFMLMRTGTRLEQIQAEINERNAP